jgi:hypothetical protein
MGDNKRQDNFLEGQQEESKVQLIRFDPNGFALRKLALEDRMMI